MNFGHAQTEKGGFASNRAGSQAKKNRLPLPQIDARPSTSARGRTLLHTLRSARRWVAEPPLDFAARVGGLARVAFRKSLRSFVWRDAAVDGDIDACTWLARLAGPHGLKG
jgi:hypothetical protein